MTPPMPPPLNPVAQLTRLLGHVVFLACPVKTKKPKGRWGLLTLADMKPEHLAKLPAGNIGVSLVRYLMDFAQSTLMRIH